MSLVFGIRTKTVDDDEAAVLSHGEVVSGFIDGSDPSSWLVPSS